MPPDALADQVRRNCDISDARFAGHYSICGLALRLRDLYKWERGLAPWVEDDADKVLAWIGAREQLWEELQDQDFLPLTIGGTSFDPFDTVGINARLISRGLFYGAGYAQSLKPSFVLGPVETRLAHNGLDVIHLGHELARDLLTLPAFSQDDTVVLRKASARLFVWDQIAYITPSRKPYLAYALQRAGLSAADPARLRAHFPSLMERLYDLFVRHEIGERLDVAFASDRWRAMIAAFPHTPIELLVRAVKDLLADTGPHGPLPGLIAQRETVALGFYMVFHDGLGRQLFPSMRAAFERFTHTGSWTDLAAAVGHIHQEASDHASRLLTLFDQGREQGDLESAAEKIQRTFLAPLQAHP